MEKVEKNEKEVRIEIIEECRICQENDSMTKLEVPCSCTGTLKYAHRDCIQKWCNEKKNLTCEICYQPFSPGYVVETPASLPGRIPATNIPGLVRDDPAESLLIHDGDDDQNRGGICNKGTIICGGLYLLLLGAELATLLYFNSNMGNTELINPICFICG